MTNIMLPCHACNGDGFVSFEDRHTETAKESCKVCKGRGSIPAATGQTAETSYNSSRRNTLMPKSKPGGGVW